MDIVSIIYAGATGSMIALCGNRTSILMIFKPLKAVYLFGRKLPFTPGALIAKKSELGELTSSMIMERLVTPAAIEKIAARIFNNINKESLCRYVDKFIVDQAINKINNTPNSVIVKYCDDFCGFINKDDMLPSIIKESVNNMPPEQIEEVFMKACGPELKRMAYAEMAIGGFFGMLLETIRQLIM